MPHFAVPRCAVIQVPIVGQPSVFPVRRVYCVGRNYTEHALEMGYTGGEPPFFFLKPGDLIYTGTPKGGGAVLPGQAIAMGAAGLGELHVFIT